MPLELYFTERWRLTPPVERRCIYSTKCSTILVVLLSASALSIAQDYLLCTFVYPRYRRHSSSSRLHYRPCWFGHHCSTNSSGMEKLNGRYCRPFPSLKGVRRYRLCCMRDKRKCMHETSLISWGERNNCRAYPAFKWKNIYISRNSVTYFQDIDNGPCRWSLRYKRLTMPVRSITK